jgi:pimeloyl-ACP methyl ester carboxylesterase
MIFETWNKGKSDMDDLTYPFKSPKGKAEFMKVYDTLMQHWPVPYETFDITGSFGCTHLIASGPKDAPALVLLHGARATLNMWSANIGDLSQDYRVYAIDIMGQPSKSIPNPSFQKREDLIPWFTELLDTLKIEKPNLVGMSYGGWFALNYAIHVPERVNQLVLLSPAACFLPLNRPHMLRGALMYFFPSRQTVRSFKLWETYPENLRPPENLNWFDLKVEQMYLGFKYFRCQGEANPDIFTDEQLSSLKAPTLLLIGQQEVIYDPVASVERARHWIPCIEADLIPHASHDMSAFQAEVVDQYILKFLKENS